MIIYPLVNRRVYTIEARGSAIRLLSRDTFVRGYMGAVVYNARIYFGEANDCRRAPSDLGIIFLSSRYNGASEVVLV